MIVIVCILLFLLFCVNCEHFRCELFYTDAIRVKDAKKINQNYCFANPIDDRSFLFLGEYRVFLLASKRQVCTHCAKPYQASFVLRQANDFYFEHFCCPFLCIFIFFFRVQTIFIQLFVVYVSLLWCNFYYYALRFHATMHGFYNKRSYEVI